MDQEFKAVVIPVGDWDFIAIVDRYEVSVLACLQDELG